jgi:hypothetical protein
MPDPAEKFEELLTRFVSNFNEPIFPVPGRYVSILVCRPVNGRSTDIDRPWMSLSRSLFNLTGHFDRLHFHAFQCDC